MDDFFYRLGRKTRAGLRKGNWVWTSLTAGEQAGLQAEYAAGSDLARDIDAQTRFNRSDDSRELLAEISGRLACRLSNKQRRWRVAAILGDEPGAFVLPGGFLYLTRPLLELCNFDPDELACVVGHEMGHVVHRHAMSRIANEILATAASHVLRVPGGLLAKWALHTGASLLRSAYSQDQEYQADEFGARLAAAAGYDPRGAIRMLGRLEGLQADAGAPLSQYFATHPPLEKRAKKLEGLIQVRRPAAD